MYPSLDPSGPTSRLVQPALTATSTYLAKPSISGPYVAHSSRADQFTLSILSLPKVQPPESDIDKAKNA